jgi:hypothetical protein
MPNVPPELAALHGQTVRIFGVERGSVDESGVRTPVVETGVVVIVPELFGPSDDDYEPADDVA